MTSLLIAFCRDGPGSRRRHAGGSHRVDLHSQTLSRGFTAGVVAGFGVALADAAYAAVAAFGLVAVTSSGERANPAADPGRGPPWAGWPGASGGTRARQAYGRRPAIRRRDGPPDFVLTLTNPMTIMSFLAVLGAGVGMALTLRIQPRWWPARSRVRCCGDDSCGRGERGTTGASMTRRCYGSTARRRFLIAGFAAWIAVMLVDQALK